MPKTGKTADRELGKRVNDCESGDPDPAKREDVVWDSPNTDSQKTVLYARKDSCIRIRGFEVVSTYIGKGINLPKRQTARSAGYDIEAAERVVLTPGEMILVKTGLKAYMLPGEVLFIKIRSSLAIKRDLYLLNQTGVIDSDYYGNPQNEGHIFIGIGNRGNDIQEIKKGDRIAQGIFLEYLLVDGDTPGGARNGGIGSTSQKEEE